ncbi:OmpA family protein [Sphingomonas hengshuiensis]|uniref:Flagellar motor protein MotB n=1 Tax=Sphingomonas hengshuiensis TaxID=1609977 RepID=A0A7U4LGF5_9SPHN|nr:OmpA family protein [Sphingomonas hengshuiensis]AJP73124.1 flagellar motor protein MotB [Sphingomonas hengshuiensis]
MRKLAVILALATTALSTPALARDDAWYVGIEGGAMLVEDIDFNLAYRPDAAKADHKYGFDVAGTVGYDLGPVRLEAEVSYRKASVDGYSSTLTTPVAGASGAYTNRAPGSFDYAGGSSSALSFMVNSLFDFGDDDGVQGFVGPGLGVARVKEKIGLNTRGNFLDDSDTVVAWQVLAGVRAPLNDSIDVSLKYRFFNAPGVELTDIAGRNTYFRYRSHSIMGGLVFNFGAPAPEPAPAPAPEPAPAPVWTPTPEPTPVAPVVQCTPGPYIVFFDWDKSDITPEAASILDNAISNYQNCGNSKVMLAGHADRSGSASYNVGLSQRRADAAKAYLTSRGISDGVISTEAFGESRPRVETADGVRELQNRRVEIQYGPGAGM